LFFRLEFEMTVERYIRVFAGLFIMVSLALGVEASPLFVSPWFLAFTAFVGVNLFQFGLTNFCPMAIILKKAGRARNRAALQNLLNPAMAHTAPPLKFVSPGWFSVVMGLVGLALAWQAASPMLGELATGVALVIGGLALGVFVLLAAASFCACNGTPRRCKRTCATRCATLLWPPSRCRCCCWPRWRRPWAWEGWAVQAVWWVGSVAQLWATLWVLGRWLAPQTGPAAQPGGLWPSITPLLFIPVVGNAVAPLAGVGLGFAGWSAAQLGIGIAFWPVLLVLTQVRRLVHGPLPERLLPTSFIAVAPPSVIGLSLLAFGAPWPVIGGFWGVALFTLLWVGSQTTRTIQQPFALAFWGLSFPLAAFATLTLKLAQAPGQGAWQTPATLALVLATLVVLALSLATVRGLRNGTLLAPEPVASLVPTAMPEEKVTMPRH
jgi:tellurite resistance protein